MSSYKISDDFFVKLAYFYVGLPFLIFVLGWLQWFIAWPILAIFLFSFYSILKSYLPDNKHFNNFFSGRYTILLALLIIVIYIFFSGIGSYSFQNEDHHYRNAIFQDLVKKQWPVVYQIKGFAAENPLEGKQALLVYYLGYWLPAAVVGKLFGLEWGRFFLFLWSVLGVFLIYYFLCQYFKKYTLKVLWLFIGWGSLYFLGTLCSFPVKDFLKGDAYLWAGNLLFADGTTGLIYWTFNQTIVPWLIILLIINQFNAKTIIFLTSLLFFSGPFSFIGFLPFAAYFILKNESFKIVNFQEVIKQLSKYFSFENTIGAFSILLISYLYFSANSSGNVFNLVVPPFTTYFVFMFLSVGIILILIYNQNQANFLYYLIVFILLILPFFQLGFGLDFTARASIPAMFLLMLLVGQYLIHSQKSARKYAVFFYLLVSGIGHNFQFTRSLYFTDLQLFSNTNLGQSLAKNNNAIIKNIGDRLLINKGKNITIKNNLDSLNNPQNVLVRNFMGTTENALFYKYLAKQNHN